MDRCVVSFGQIHIHKENIKRERMSDRERKWMDPCVVSFGQIHIHRERMRDRERDGRIGFVLDFIHSTISRKKE